MEPSDSWKWRVSWITEAPESSTAACREISERTARSTERKELTFFVSVRVPSGASGEGRSETLSTTAGDPALRDTLKGLAVVALMGQGLLSASTTDQHALLLAAGSRLLNTNDDLTGLRAGIGFAEERIETARVRGEAEATGLEAALGVLINADPYETALCLQEAETRVATIYTITARISSLSLVAVLR